MEGHFLSSSLFFIRVHISAIQLNQTVGQKHLREGNSKKINPKFNVASYIKQTPVIVQSGASVLFLWCAA